MARATREAHYGALGISRTRFAELLYEHEGFVDHSAGQHAPERETPVWIEERLLDPHSGDCTKQPWSCMTCHASMALEQADEFIDMIIKAKGPTDA